MSIHIAFDDRPEYYSNLDTITGKIILRLKRAEQIGSIVVKLEGEASTALQVPHPYQDDGGIVINGPPPGPPGAIITETHKVLYKVQQVFPDDYYASANNPFGAHPLLPGEHTFPFRFKIPINNACSDQRAMARIGGLGGVGGFGTGGGLFGGSVRVMDGSKQLFLQHRTRTLPPSLTGFPREAEIRYFIKVTVQRPSFLKENWRLQAGFKFLPMESPRPKKTAQEVFVRRPFTFRPKPPGPPERKRTGSSFFSKKAEDSNPDMEPPGTVGGNAPPSIEICARLPFPPIITCLHPVPLRLMSKKLADSLEEVFLVSFEMVLTGVTEIRCRNIHKSKPNSWIVASNTNICIPLTSSPLGEELVLPNDLWANVALPNTVAPSFQSCNLIRRYELEIKLGVSWGKPGNMSSGKFSRGVNEQPPCIYLPLKFAQVEVFSGMTPPAELLAAQSQQTASAATFSTGPPRLPPRSQRADSVNNPIQQTSSPIRVHGPSTTQTQRPGYDPLYPPQLLPGEQATTYDDAPPSYNEAIADDLVGPFDGLQRPAYSGATNENGPSQIPGEKS